MLKDLTYKKKNQLLVAVAIAVIYFVYSLAIQKTIVAHNEYTAAKSQMELAANAPKAVSQLEKQLHLIDLKIGDQNADQQNTVQALLEVITNYCQKNHVILREFPETTAAKQGELLIETNFFVVEGTFASLINLVYVLEQKEKLGKIASVNYQLKKDLESKEMALTAAIYLQNIKQQHK